MAWGALVQRYRDACTAARIRREMGNQPQPRSWNGGRPRKSAPRTPPTITYNQRRERFETRKPKPGSAATYVRTHAAEVVKAILGGETILSVSRRLHCDKYVVGRVYQAHTTPRQRARIAFWKKMRSRRYADALLKPKTREKPTENRQRQARTDAA